MIDFLPGGVGPNGGGRDFWGAWIPGGHYGLLRNYRIHKVFSFLKHTKTIIQLILLESL